ncbi:MAG: DNA-processing protein DprA [Anaerolineaceae bacterium]
MKGFDRKYWLAFSQVKGIGSARFRKLLTFFGNLQMAWEAPLERFISAGIPTKIAEEVLARRSTFDFEKFEESLTKKGIKTLIWSDEAYPKYLSQIEQPPPVLYILGELTPADDLAIAIVGTRNVTQYGRQVTHDSAAYLAGNGVTIVSGLARGVDGIAHQAALDVGGRTIAVLGSGVDMIYPPEHRKLAERIAASGAVISDYPPGTKPDGTNFPPRNRIISGLSRGTIVIEAGETSGALITAKFSLEQNREVFAVPGSVLAPMSKGTNRLIVDGATPMNDPRQVLEFLNIQEQRLEIHPSTVVLPDAAEQRVLVALGNDALHIDDLCNKLDLSMEKLTALLTMMELKGLVSRDHLMEYSKTQSWKF